MREEMPTLHLGGYGAMSWFSRPIQNYCAMHILTVRSFLDQFQTLPYNSLIFRTLIQPDSNSTVHGWVQGVKQAKSRRTANFQKLCDFSYLPDVENRPENKRTVSI
jgi:hypothetical protein